MECLPRRAPLQADRVQLRLDHETPEAMASEGADLRARERTAATSARVRCRPPSSAFVIAAWLLRMTAGVISRTRLYDASARLIRGPVRASIQRRSQAATKCQVGRSAWVRTIVPASTARSTAASVAAFVRWASAPLRA